MSCDVQVEDVRKVYASGVEALRGVTLAVEAGQCLAMVGPSGCGKTTLLRVIAGLEDLTGGTVRLGGRVVNGVPAHRREVAMVFQRPALVPGQTVRENLAWSWTLGRSNPWHLLRAMVGQPARTTEQERHLDELAGMLGIGGLLDRRAGELSGGQQQRVALGRALLRRAPVCLLDEPLGHLEAHLRSQLRRDLRLLSRRFPATMIHVTHDPAEALAVGDRVAVLNEGRLQQVGPPAEVLRRPANRFVAELCQPEGPWNFLDGRLEESGGQTFFVAAPWLRLAVGAEVRARLGGGAVTLGVWSGDVKILAAEAVRHAAAGRIIDMHVALTEFAARGSWVLCEREGVRVTGRQAGGPALAIGQRVMVEIGLEQAYWFETSTGMTLGAPAG
jgi:multiple sugar transport system ATP-binding protein